MKVFSIVLINHSKDQNWQEWFHGGNIHFSIDIKGGKRYINKVLLVPIIYQNLQNMGQMMEKGYTLHFKGDSGIIYNKKGKFFVIAKI